AELGGGEPQQGEVRTVAQHQRHPVARRDTETGERTGQLVTAGVDLGERQRARRAAGVEDPRGPVRPQLGGPDRQPGQVVDAVQRAHADPRARKRAEDSATSAAVSVIKAWATSSSSAGSRAESMPESSARLASVTAYAGFSAMARAHCSAAARASGTTALTSPRRPASAPLIRSPSRSSSLAFSGPTSNGSRRETPPVTLRPSPAS